MIGALASSAMDASIPILVMICLKFKILSLYRGGPEKASFNSNEVIQHATKYALLLILLFIIWEAQHGTLGLIPPDLFSNLYNKVKDILYESKE